MHARHALVPLRAYYVPRVRALVRDNYGRARAAEMDHDALRSRFQTIQRGSFRAAGVRRCLPPCGVQAAVQVVVTDKCLPIAMGAWRYVH